MDRLFVGILFLLFDFNLTLNGHSVGLLPDFVGYLLLFTLPDRFSQQSPALQKCRRMSVWFGAYSLFSYLLALLIAQPDPLLRYGIGLVEMVFRLYFLYQLVQGLRQLEAVYGLSLCTASLQKRWALITAFQVFSLMLIYSLLISALCSVISFVGGILFAYTLNTARLQWNRSRGGAL